MGVEAAFTEVGKVRGAGIEASESVLRLGDHISVAAYVHSDYGAWLVVVAAWFGLGGPLFMRVAIYFVELLKKSLERPTVEAISMKDE